VPDHGALVARWWAVWYDGAIGALDEIVADTFVATVARNGGPAARSQDDMVQYH
jgi:hypothetical protein